VNYHVVIIIPQTYKVKRILVPAYSIRGIQGLRSDGNDFAQNWVCESFLLEILYFSFIIGKTPSPIPLPSGERIKVRGTRRAGDEAREI
jgi:hypothetical protein